jgi:TonB family protein
MSSQQSKGNQMRNPRQFESSRLVSSFLYLSLLISGLPGYVSAQQPGPVSGTARGIQLYQQGDAVGAIKVLKEALKMHPDDADAWYYLGLALNSQGLIAEARTRFVRLIELRPDSFDAHAKLAYALILANKPESAVAMGQRAIELGDQSPEAHYAIAEANFRTDSPEKAIQEAEAALLMKPDFLPALITKSLAHFQLKQYSEAADSLDKFLASSPDNVDANVWSDQLRAMRDRALKSTATPAASEPTVLTGKGVTQKARVLSKPEPSYTEAARYAGVEGSVVLRGVFSSDGEVKHLEVIRALGYGLTTQAVRAARQIKFQPATKDGRNVSMYIQLEYNFNLY